MKNGLLNVICAIALLSGCPAAVATDAGPLPGTDSGPVADTGPPDAGPAACGADGLPCLTVGTASMNMPADMACTRSEPAPGTASSRTLRLVARGTGIAPIMNGAFEIWPGNAVGATCTAPACVMLTSGATDGTVTTSLDDGYFAYHVPQNASAMTYRAIGYNRTASAGATTDIIATPSAIFMAAIGGIRMGFMADPVDAILLGDVSDCDGEEMRGVTVRMFAADGTEIMNPATVGPLDPGLAYRNAGVFPRADMTTTDYSGGYAAGNIPILADPRVAVVAYGTTTMGGTRGIIACEEVVVGANAMTFLSFGPYRSDYPVGNLCLMHAPAAP